VGVLGGVIQSPDVAEHTEIARRRNRTPQGRQIFSRSLKRNIAQRDFKQPMTRRAAMAGMPGSHDVVPSIIRPGYPVAKDRV
jgi:hypothetical protein